MADVTEPNQTEKLEPTLQDLIDQDPDFHKGSGTFDFPNGDKYEGEFYAHRSGKVWREGRGVYTTKDGQIYSGYWEDDKLVEDRELEITYADGTKFCGTMVDNKYSGPGMIIFENNMKISCEFVENKPVGPITLFDKNDKMWFGVAEKDAALLMPEHIFFSDINKDRGKGICRKPEVVIEIKEKRSSKSSKASKSSSKGSKSSKTSLKVPSAEITADKFRAYREWEWEVFRKKSRVDDTIDFEDSEWYQNYLKFKNTYEPVITKAKAFGKDSLNPDELELYEKYYEFKIKYKKSVEKFKAPKEFTKSLKSIYEEVEEFKKKCPPVSILYPSEKSLSDYLDELGSCDENEEN